uniref:Transcription repressor n=1 Tax=Oryza punctata TaxID=4537 RepID=A0A0E0JLD5_ORYPU
MHTPFVDKSPHRRRDGLGAGGWLKQRLAQILVRSTCTTNTTTTTTTSSTAFVSLDKTNADTHQEPPAPPSPYFCTPCTYQRPKLDGAGRPRRRRRSASLVHISIDCTGGAGATSGRRSVHSDAPLLPYSSSLPTKDGRKVSRARRKPRSPSTSRRHCPSSSWGRARLPRGTPGQYSCSSSTVTDDELVPFSTDEEGGEEADTRTLFSSLSFSSDSTSEFYHTNSSSSLARKVHKNAPRRPPPRRASTRTTSDLDDAFRPVVSVAATKQHSHNEHRNDMRKKEEKAIKKQLGADDTGDVGAGMAVVKRSSNPYADFRSSMVEMVVERRICSVPEMEELLGSYLSLNSPQHHPAILAAFEDVWEAVFGEE